MKKILTLFLAVAVITFSLSGCSASGDGETIYGQVTAISGSSLTIETGTLNEDTVSPNDTNESTEGSSTESAVDSSNQDSDGTTTEPPVDAVNQDGTAPEIPEDGAAQDGTPPDMPAGDFSGTMPEGMGQMLTLDGETIEITIDDSTTITQQAMGQSDDETAATEAVLEDITVGSILQITYASNGEEISAIEILSGGGMSGGDIGGGSQTVETGTGAYNLTDSESLSGGTYTSSNDDENAVRAEGEISASMTDVTVEKTDGTASSSDASSFYGLNAAILALDGATLDISGGTVTATSEGSNGVFAYDGATINISDTTIDVSGGNAGGIEVAGGGIMNASNLTVNATVKAAIRSDRGGGTMVVDGGTYTTSGSTGAPAVYSTADITVKNATLTANTSEAIVVEGLNSVILENCIVSGNMTGSNSGSDADNIHNVMLYQSMSGDAEVGNSSFTMTGGRLTSLSGDMFYVTNTTSDITLSDVTLVPAADTYLLMVAGNDGTQGWGTAGSNGGECVLTTSSQTLEGDIMVDSISTLDMSLSEGSTFTGSINNDGTSASSLKVTLDENSTWALTADSYITELDGDMSQITTNGYTLYVNGIAAN
ncbi:hypothetical protein Q5O24_02430 [Eubacteriaceae bacterium ES3]|nr:hypothetical protein Q5O24_02430 [Eubacteriaceae bacterium ES3]